MTAGKSTETPQRGSAPPRHNAAAKRWFEHSSGNRINTDTVAVEAIRAEYPQLHLTVVPRSNCDLIGYASAGHAGLAQIDKAQDRLSWRLFLPPARRLDGGQGGLADTIKFGKYLLDWQGKEFVVYVVSGFVRAWEVHGMEYADPNAYYHRSMEEMGQSTTLRSSTNTYCLHL